MLKWPNVHQKPTRSMLVSMRWVSVRSSFKALSLPCWRAREAAHAQWIAVIQLIMSLLDEAYKLKNVHTKTYIQDFETKYMTFSHYCVLCMTCMQCNNVLLLLHPSQQRQFEEAYNKYSCTNETETSIESGINFYYYSVLGGSWYILNRACLQWVHQSRRNRLLTSGSARTL